MTPNYSVSIYLLLVLLLLIAVNKQTIKCP